MPVSYVSQPLQSSPYVKPLNLDLLSSVLSYKQQQYDTEADKVQNQINSISAQTQGMNEADRQYFNGKLNSIVNNINSLGGVDLSDKNIGNQIEGFASSIYNDSTILSAVSAASKINSLQKSYQEAKTNPKLAKSYSAANEWYDMQAVNQYYQNQKAGEGYHGNSSYTPYAEYDKQVNLVLDKMKATKWSQRRAANGKLELYKEDGSRVTAEDVRSVVQGTLNGDQLAQMQRDGAYSLLNIKGYQKPDLALRAAALSNQNVRHLNDEIQSLSSQILTGTGNQEELKQKRLTLITQRNKSIQTSASEYLNLSDKDLATSIFYETYMNGKIARNAYTDISNDVAVNPIQKFLIEEQNKNLRGQDKLRTAKEIAGNKLDREKEKDRLNREAQSNPNGVGASLNSISGGSVLLSTKEPLNNRDIYNNVNTKIESINTEMNNAIEVLIGNAARKNGLKLDDIYKDYNGDGKVDINDLSYWSGADKNQKREFLKEGIGTDVWGKVENPEIKKLFENINQAVMAHVNNKDLTIEGKYSEEVLSTIEKLSFLQLKKEGYEKLLNKEGIKDFEMDSPGFFPSLISAIGYSVGAVDAKDIPTSTINSKKPNYREGQHVNYPIVNYNARTFSENDYNKPWYKSLLGTLTASNPTLQAHMSSNPRIVSIGKQNQNDGSTKVIAKIAWEKSSDKKQTTEPIEVPIESSMVANIIPMDNQFTPLDFIINKNNIPEIPVYNTTTNGTGKSTNFMVKMRVLPKEITVGDGKGLVFRPQIFDNENQVWLDTQTTDEGLASQAGMRAHEIIKACPNRKALIDKIRKFN